MRSLRRAVVAALLCLPLLAACATPGGTPAAGATPGPSGARSPSPSADPCAPWGCAQQARFTTAAGFVGLQRGHLGIVVRDRVTGAVWQAGETNFRYWASSTPKLALAVALKEDARAGKITLTSAQNADMDAMLHVSDNGAADRLWDFYGNPAALMHRFQTTFGMSTADYVSGFPNRWGFIKMAPTDLEHLISYVLEKLNPDDRAFFLTRMRSVGQPQQWGVWGAGTSLMPGVKDGWSDELDGGVDHYNTSTVGFAGPDARYTVAAMYYQLPGGDTKEKGIHVLTDLVATVFGAPVPAPAQIPLDE